LDNYLTKFIDSIKSRGILNTFKSVRNKLVFESKCLFTSIKLSASKFFPGNKLIVNHGKYKFYFYGGGDRNEILYHTFWEKMFDEEKKKISKFIKRGDTVIDVGGNMGFFILILNELVSNTGKMYSFEPSRILRDRLASTVQINNIKNVEIINLALGEKEGTTSLYYNPKQSGLSSIVSHEENGFLKEEIKITTLDNFSKQFSSRISFIKIDTEGYEPQVLRGAKELIKKDKPVIYIELGGDHLETSVEALKILKELGYYCEAEEVDLSKTLAGINFIATPKFQK
jgi:FkbM family methyltransferase